MMKNLTLIALFLFSALSAFSQKVNDKIQIESNGSWYDGKILKVNEAEKQYYVTYDGWSESWNEWVGTDRIRGYETAKPEPAPAAKKFKVGDHVEVEYGMIPEPATIIEVGENKYHIQFDKKVFGDKWVSEGQIKKL